MDWLKEGREAADEAVAITRSSGTETPAKMAAMIREHGKRVRERLAQRFARELAAARWGAWRACGTSRHPISHCATAIWTVEAALDALQEGFEQRLTEVARG